MSVMPHLSFLKNHTQNKENDTCVHNTNYFVTYRISIDAWQEMHIIDEINACN